MAYSPARFERFEWRDPEMGPRTRLDQWREVTGRNRTAAEMETEADEFSRDLSRATEWLSWAATAVNPAVGMTLGAAGSSISPDKQHPDKQPSLFDQMLMAGMMTVGGGGRRPSRVANSPEGLAAMRSAQAAATRTKYGQVHQKVMAAARPPRRVAVPEGLPFNNGAFPNPKGAVLRVSLPKPTAKPTVFQEGWEFASPQVRGLFERAAAEGAGLRTAAEAQSKTLAARFKRGAKWVALGAVGAAAVGVPAGMYRHAAEKSENAKLKAKDDRVRAVAAAGLHTVLDDPAIGSAEAMARALATPESYGQYLTAVRSAFASNYVNAADVATAKDLREDVVGRVSELESRLLQTNAGAVRYYDEMMQVLGAEHPLRDGLRKDMDAYDMKLLEAQLEGLKGGPHAK